MLLPRRNLSSLSCDHGSILLHRRKILQDTPSISTDSTLYSSLLRWCGDHKKLQEGMCIHGNIIFHGLSHDSFLQGLLVQMYGKCGALQEASHVFHDMLDPSPYAWNFIIRSCSQQGECGISLQLFQQMYQQASIPDKFTYVCALSACNAVENLRYGKQIHARFVNTEIECNCAIGTTIVGLYANSRKSDEAVASFDRILDPDVIVWNAMLAAYGRNGDSQQASQCFSHMLLQGFLPNKATFVSMLDSCSDGSDLTKGERLHVHILSCESDLVLDNALINMYGKCGNMQSSWAEFNTMSSRSIVTWTTLISLYVYHGDREQALTLFIRMQQEAMMPQRVTFLAILSACDCSELLPKGEQIHVHLSNANDQILKTEVINMYGRCGSIENACKMFHETLSWDVVAWNTMISVYAQNNLDVEALNIFSQMIVSRVTPTTITFLNVVSVCDSISQGRIFHDYIIELGFVEHVALANAILNMYGQYGFTEDASITFNKMKSQDVISWNSMLAVFLKNEKFVETVKLFEQMLGRGISPDKVTYNTILEAYAKFPATSESELRHTEGRDTWCEASIEDSLSRYEVLQKAFKLFEGMPDRDVQSWNAFIGVYIQHSEEREEFILQRMQMEGVLPNSDSYIAMLSLCAREREISEGKRVHASICHAEYERDFAVGTSVINMYGNFDKVNDARWAFDRFSEWNIVLATAMIAVCIQSGQDDESLTLFHRMLQVGLLPNRVTYISALDACTKLSALHEGKRMHACIVSTTMSSDDVIRTVLVDMYSKCGSLKDMRMIFHEMPSHDMLLWNTVISLYSQHGMARHAFKLFDAIREQGLRPDKVTFISILTACSHCGLVDQGICCLNSMFDAYGVPPTLVHYVCMIDVLGRTGQLDKVRRVIGEMPFQPSEVPYVALLRACHQQQSDLEHGEWAAKHSFELDRGNSAPYVLLSNIHAGHKQWER